MIRCRAHPCRELGHQNQLAFCTAHYQSLTPLKRAKVEALRSLNALDPAARVIIDNVILESRRYLAARQERKTA